MALTAMLSFPLTAHGLKDCSSEMTGGDGFIQIGNWRFGQVGNNEHFSFSSNTPQFGKRTALILRSDGTVHGGGGSRADWGLWDQPLTWTYNAANPNLDALPSVKFGDGYVQFGTNERVGIGDQGHLSMSFKDSSINGRGIHTSDIWRSDGTIHPGPRTCCGLDQLNTWGNSATNGQVWFGDRFVQFGDFRIAEIDGAHMSIVNVRTGWTAEILRWDSTQHPGPRQDFNANTRPKYDVTCYRDNDLENKEVVRKAAAEVLAAFQAKCYVAGMYLTSTTSCSPCPAGQFQSSTRQARCNVCVKGTFSASVGATSSTTCAVCIQGKFSSLDGSLSCAACATGQFQSGQGSSSCTLCAQGQFQVNIVFLLHLFFYSLKLLF
jgi:hypothetical protein